MKEFLYKNRYLLYIALTFFVALIAGSWSVPLFDVDEGAFSEATREMVVSGNYLTTWLNGVPRFDKPILIYWFQAVSVILFGVEEFSFRLPSILAGLGWVTASYMLARQYLDRQKASVAAIMVSASLGVMLIGRAATADALLNLLLVLTLADIYRYYQKPRSVLVYRVFLWIALGVLTKGPVAILIPLSVSGVFFLWQRCLLDWLKAVFSPVGWAIFAVVALPWYLFEYLDQGQAFIDGFFMRHNVERFTSSLEQHAGSLFYYVPVVLLLILPFTGLLWDAVKSFSLRLGSVNRQNSFHRFLWVWFLFVLLFFSFSGTKLPHYVLYGMTPLIILLADGYCRSDRKWLLVIPALLLPGVVLAFPLILDWLRHTDLSPYYADMLKDAPEASLWQYIYVGGLFVGIFSLPFWAPKIVRLFVVAFAGACAVSFVLMPQIGLIKQAPVKEAALIAANHGGQLVQWRIHVPSIAVYRQQPVPRREPQAGELAVTRSDHRDDIPDGALIIYEKGGIILFKVKG